MDIEGAWMLDEDEALLTCVVTGPTAEAVALAKAVLVRALEGDEDTDLDDQDPSMVVLSRVVADASAAAAELRELCGWARRELEANACSVASFHVDEEAL